MCLEGDHWPGLDWRSPGKMLRVTRQKTENPSKPSGPRRLPPRPPETRDPQRLSQDTRVPEVQEMKERDFKASARNPKRGKVGRMPA